MPVLRLAVIPSLPSGLQVTHSPAQSTAIPGSVTASTGPTAGYFRHGCSVPATGGNAVGAEIRDVAMQPNRQSG